MPRITYLQPDGSRITCRIETGESVLDGALDNGVPGILGQCGGACTCATCHCYVTDPDIEPAADDELELLSYVPDRRSSSRLACQIRLNHPDDALEVQVPEHQL